MQTKPSSGLWSRGGASVWLPTAAVGRADGETKEWTTGAMDCGRRLYILPGTAATSSLMLLLLRGNYPVDLVPPSGLKASEFYRFHPKFSLLFPAKLMVSHAPDRWIWRQRYWKSVVRNRRIVPTPIQYYHHDAGTTSRRTMLIISTGGHECDRGSIVTQMHE